jgi:hypothetical protein
MRGAVLVLAVVVSGCAVPMTKVVSASERTVVVQAISGDMAAAQAAADQACSAHGRKARLSQNIEGAVQYIYDCDR